MTDLARWLDERQPPATPAVRTALEPWLADSDAALPLEDQLAESAMRALETVVARSSERSTATILLAADALLTYACEAAGEAGPEALDRLTRDLSFDRFAQLLLTAS